MCPMLCQMVMELGLQPLGLARNVNRLSLVSTAQPNHGSAINNATNAPASVSLFDHRLVLGAPVQIQLSNGR
jgi:hypothetical protein